MCFAYEVARLSRIPVIDLRCSGCYAPVPTRTRGCCGHIEDGATASATAKTTSLVGLDVADRNGRPSEDSVLRVVRW